MNNWVGDDALSSGGGHWRELLLDEWSLREPVNYPVGHVKEAAGEPEKR